MILNVTNKNKEMVCRALAQGIKHSYYNPDCFSTGDIRRYRDLMDDVASIIRKIAFHGVNLHDEIVSAFELENVSFNVDFLKETFKNIQQDKNTYDISMNSHSIWRVVETDELRNLFSKGSAGPIEEEYFTLYDVDSLPVPVLKLNLDKKGSIEYLLNNDKIFNESYSILKEKLTGYSLNEVICIKEPESKKIGSEIKMVYSNDNSEITAIVNENGRKSDILLIKDGSIFDVISLKDNIFNGAANRRVLSEEEIFHYYNIQEKYWDKWHTAMSIYDSVKKDIHFTEHENFAMQYTDYQDYIEEYHFNSLYEIFNESYFSEEQFSMIKKKEFELSNILTSLEKIIVGEDLIKEFKKADNVLSENIIQLNTPKLNELKGIKYTCPNELLNYFNKLIVTN